MHELPLVFFTVLGQLSAGMVLLSSLSCFINHSQAKQVIRQKINGLALLFMALGMLIASFHLGHPMRAFNVILGIGRSPMSNEIFTFSVLFGVTLVSLLLNYFALNPNSEKLDMIKPLCLKINRIPYINQLLAIVLMILSLVFVWTIVLTYRLPTVKTWDTVYTSIQMYLTMLALGGIASARVGLYRLGIGAFIIGVLLIVLSKVPYFNLMTSISPALANAQLSWMIIECILLIVALMLIIFSCWRTKHMTILCTTAFACTFLGEVCGRIAFYNLWTIPL
ncbi:dimethyl sulfoxide reductase anchor subunit family protein [Gilliamella sp. CG16]|uniref:dimethyl sulfoxide reductase anchor subunit family protein n=1 Tax=Gilliamella sp. CG16 TaxID=3351503 RepID=UPI0039856C0D